ncbi:MAG TPA: aminopeptidase [Candidatus Limnocylindria bacterium]|nr:aminopeptidase [Candidatus Limnocylindria bacterium]
MTDPRITRLADILVNFSLKVKPGDRVWIDLRGTDHAMAEALAEAVFRAGGHPLIKLIDNRVQRALLLGYTEEQLEWLAAQDAAVMAQCACYIGVRGGENAFETADVPQARNAMWDRTYGKMVHREIRVPKTRWVVLRYPTQGMAQQAGMSTRGFEDFYFDVCTMDYAKMDRAMDALAARMRRTDAVRLTGRDTDLTFSIKGQAPIKCAGEMNIPDGEIFTAPIRDSVQGRLHYNTPSLYDGVTHEDICFTFRDGKIVEATGSQEKLLNEILDSDEGARYIGEFAIGVNPYVTRPMKDTLFDEKIAGSFHFTPGMCYDEAPNGNESVIHWDLVMIQTPEYGGGDMYFDGELIRRDGLFVPEDLHALNPDALKG